MVIPGSKPLVQVAPPSVEVAKPTSAPPPLKIRPTWKALTIVEPKANESGSTSVACWLLVLVNISVLNFVSGTCDGGGGGVVVSMKCCPEPQARVNGRTIARMADASACFIP